MKSQQLHEKITCTTARAIPPGEAPVPVEIVQNRCFHGDPRGQQIVHLHRDEGGQYHQLNSDSDGSH
jgi:hypothetical protein